MPISTRAARDHVDGRGDLREVAGLRYAMHVHICPRRTGEWLAAKGGHQGPRLVRGSWVGSGTRVGSGRRPTPTPTRRRRRRCAATACIAAHWSAGSMPARSRRQPWGTNSPKRMGGNPTRRAWARHDGPVILAYTAAQVRAAEAPLLAAAPDRCAHAARCVSRSRSASRASCAAAGAGSWGRRSSYWSARATTAAMRCTPAPSWPPGGARAGGGDVLARPPTGLAALRAAGGAVVGVGQPG